MRALRPIPVDLVVVDNPGVPLALVDLLLHTLPVGGPELELLELACGGASQFAAELDGCRALEVRQPVATVVDKVLFVREIHAFCP